MISSTEICPPLFPMKAFWESSEHHWGAPRFVGATLLLFCTNKLTAVSNNSWPHPCSPQWWYQCWKARDTAFCFKNWPGFKNYILVLCLFSMNPSMSSMDLWFKVWGTLMMQNEQCWYRCARWNWEIEKWAAHLESKGLSSFSALKCIAVGYIVSSLNFFMYKKRPDHFNATSHR